jgi:hypothetical protein
MEVRLDMAAKLDGDRLAGPVLGPAGRDADPTLTGAVLLHVDLLGAVEAHAHAALQRGRVVVPARRVHGQAVGRFVGHRVLEDGLAAEPPLTVRSFKGRSVVATQASAAELGAREPTLPAWCAAFDGRTFVEPDVDGKAAAEARCGPTTFGALSCGYLGIADGR